MLVSHLCALEPTANLYGVNWRWNHGYPSDILIQKDQNVAIASFGVPTAGYMVLISKDHLLSIEALPSDRFARQEGSENFAALTLMSLQTG